MSYLNGERRAIERAPFLFAPEQLPCDVLNRLVQREQDQRDWTAARFFAERRGVYDVVVRMLGAALPVRLIADLCGVTEKTVCAVRDAEPDAVTAFRATMTKRRVAMLHRCADVIAAALEGAASGSDEAANRAKDIAVVMNILDGQQRLDQGAPTQIVQVNQPPAVERFESWIREAIEVEETGLRAGERGTKGCGGAGGGGPERALEDRAEGGARDE